MSIYILVEGKRTELKVYPEWIKHINPDLTRVFDPFKATKNDYFIISGEGYPNLLVNHLPNALKDFKQNPNFTKFILCLDSDDKEENILRDAIDKILLENKSYIDRTQAILIFQKRTIESWFLANRKIFKRNPSDENLRNYIEFFDVSNSDPSIMEKPNTFPGSIGDFHTKYLKLIFKERGIDYSKRNPGCVKDNHYFSELVARSRSTGHIKEFEDFLNIFAVI